MKFLNPFVFTFLFALFISSCIDFSKENKNGVTGITITSSKPVVSFETSNEDLDVRVINVDDIADYEPLGSDTSLITLIFEEGRDTLGLEWGERYKLFLKDIEQGKGVVISFFLHPDSIVKSSFFAEASEGSYTIKLDDLELKTLYTLQHNFLIVAPVIYLDRGKMLEERFVEKHGKSFDDVKSLWKASISMNIEGNIFSQNIQFPSADEFLIKENEISSEYVVVNSKLLLDENVKIEYSCKSIECDIDPDVIEFKRDDYLDQDTIRLDTVFIQIE